MKKMYVVLVSVGLLVTLGLYQNCGSSKKFSSSTLPSADPLVGGSGDKEDPIIPQTEVPPILPEEPVPEKGRYVFSSQTSTNEFLPLVKLVLIVDNSMSMSQFQTLLANGMRNMLNKLKAEKLNVDFYLYTTSASPGTNNSSASKGVTKYFDLEDRPLASAPAQNVSHKRVISYDLASSLALQNGVSLGIRAVMDDSSVTSVSDELFKRIQNIGTNGSDTESGLCTLMRVLKSNTVIKKGDRAAILILSDENDSGQAANCHQTVEETYTVTSTTVTSIPAATSCSSGANCILTYKMGYKTFLEMKGSLAYNSTCPSDGGYTVPCTKSSNFTFNCTTNPSLCAPGSLVSNSKVCSPEILTAAISQAKLSSNTNPTCSYTISQKTNTVTLSEQVDRNICTSSFENGGVTYDNFQDYVLKKNPSLTPSHLSTGCNRSGLTVQSKTPVTSTVLRTDKKSAIRDALLGGIDDLLQVKQTLQDTLGESNYKISFVINDPAKNVGLSCPAGSDRNYGLRYSSFAQLIDKNAQLSSICSTNYDLVVRDLGQFIEEVANRSYKLSNFKKPVRIKSVGIIRSGVELETPQTNYTVDNQQPPTITFRDGLLMPLDELSVEWEEIL